MFPEKNINMSIRQNSSVYETDQPSEILLGQAIGPLNIGHSVESGRDGERSPTFSSG